MPRLRFEVYMDAARQWRWRARAKNGKIVADGSEGYYQRSNAQRAAERFIGYFADGVGQDNATITCKKARPVNG